VAEFPSSTKYTVRLARGVTSIKAGTAGSGWTDGWTLRNILRIYRNSFIPWLKEMHHKEKNLHFPFIFTVSNTIHPICVNKCDNITSNTVYTCTSYSHVTCTVALWIPHDIHAPFSFTLSIYVDKKIILKMRRHLLIDISLTVAAFSLLAVAEGRPTFHYSQHPYNLKPTYACLKHY